MSVSDLTIRIRVQPSKLLELLATLKQCRESADAYEKEGRIGMSQQLRAQAFGMKIVLDALEPSSE